MAHVASKIRRVGRKPMAEGVSMIPNAGVRIWYSNNLLGYVRRLTAIVRKTFQMAASGSVVHDSLFSDIMAWAMDRIKEQFDYVLGTVASVLASSFVSRVDQTSKASVNSTMMTLGSNAAPQSTSERVSTALGAQINTNVSLIKSLTDDMYHRIGMAVNNSLVSEDPENQGMRGIYRHLTEIEGIADGRAKFIAQDQTSKVYVTLNTERMREAGIAKFRWVHRGAGKTHRHTHVEHDGQIFLLAGGPDELYYEDGSDANADLPKGDKGKPGWAPHCHCSMVAVIDI